MTAHKTDTPRLLASSPVRLASLATIALVAIAAAVGLLVHWRLTDLLTAQVVDAVRVEGSTLAEHLAVGDIAALTRAIEARSRVPGAGLYLLTDAAGNSIAGNLSEVPRIGAVGAGGDVFGYSRVLAGGPANPGEVHSEQRLAFAVAIDVPGGGQLVVGRDIEEQRRFAALARWAMLAATGMLVVVTLAMGLWAGRRLLGRVEAINTAGRTIMAGNLSQRLPLDGSNDELDRLAGGLNLMLDRIEQLMRSLKEVSDNIAHDLKTPLSRLRNRAEAALRDGSDPRSQREALAHVIEGADDLIATFNALLSIARLEAGSVAERGAEMDVADVVAGVVELYEPVAEDAGVGLVVGSIDEVHVVAHRELVGQALANLVDNAIKYSTAAPSPPSGPIEVSLKALPGSVEIVVADRGPGIAVADRQRVLERFVRLEASRSRPGTGLGLSLVAAVARLHGGSVRLEDNAPGLRVVLSLARSGHRAARFAVAE